MDKGQRRAVDQALEAATGDLGGEIFHDLTGPAVYRLEPSPVTVIACAACHHVGLVPSVPVKPRLIWTCGGCGRRHALEPPARVWLEGSRPQILH